MNKEFSFSTWRINQICEKFSKFNSPPSWTQSKPYFTHSSLSTSLVHCHTSTKKYYYFDTVDFLPPIWHRDIFVKWAYVAGSFLESEGSFIPNGNLGFLLLIVENVEAWSASSFLPFHLLLPHACSRRTLCSYSHLLLPHITHTRSHCPPCALVTLVFWSSPFTHSLSSLSVFLSLIFSIVVCALVFTVVVFFRCLEWLLKVRLFCAFPWKRTYFLSFKGSSCMIFVWGLGLWNKGWSFMGFFMKREDLYLVSRIRILRRYDFC